MDVLFSREQIIQSVIIDIGVFFCNKKFLQFGNFFVLFLHISFVFLEGDQASENMALISFLALAFITLS